MVEVTEAGKVIYKTEHNAAGRFPEPGDDELSTGPSRTFQVFDPLGVLAEVTQHIPDPVEPDARATGMSKCLSVNPRRSPSRRELRNHLHPAFNAFGQRTLHRSAAGLRMWGMDHADLWQGPVNGEHTHFADWKSVWVCSWRGVNQPYSAQHDENAGDDFDGGQSFGLFVPVEEALDNFR